MSEHHERILPGASYSQPAHFQTAWWAGYKDAQAGRDYHNPRVLLVDRYEYQQGYLTGGPTEHLTSPPDLLE